MNAEILKTSVNERVIDWINPDPEVEVMLDDYQNMIQQAEAGKGMSLSEYTNKVNQWLKSNL
jgi:hypothetical protein